MKRGTMVLASVATFAVLGSSALAQQPQPSRADCKVATPAKVDGQVVRVDQGAKKLTVRDKDGKMVEFQATADMLQTMKPGDRIEATLREAPKC
jgi:hypothetical protein